MTKLEKDIYSQENFDEYYKTEKILRKYMTMSLKAWNFAVNVLGINTEKYLQNVFTAWKIEMQCEEIFKRC